MIGAPNSAKRVKCLLTIVVLTGSFASVAVCSLGCALASVLNIATSPCSCAFRAYLTAYRLFAYQLGVSKKLAALSGYRDSCQPSKNGAEPKC